MNDNRLPLIKKHSSTALFSDIQLIDALRDIFQHFGYDLAALGVDAQQDIANRLSIIARRDEPWGWRYVHNFMSGNVQAGQNFKAAIIGLASLIDGAPLQLVQGRSVVITALGRVAPGALVFGDSRACANPGCVVHFVPRVHNQRYCCRSCRAR